MLEMGKPLAKITPEDAESLFATPEEFDAAFNRRKGQEMATLWNGVKLFTAISGEGVRIYWLQGFGATPGWDVEQALEALRERRTGLVVKGSDHASRS